MLWSREIKEQLRTTIVYSFYSRRVMVVVSRLVDDDDNIYNNKCMFLTASVQRSARALRALGSPGDSLSSSAAPKLPLLNTFPFLGPSC